MKEPSTYTPTQVAYDVDIRSIQDITLITELCDKLEFPFREACDPVDTYCPDSSLGLKGVVVNHRQVKGTTGNHFAVVHIWWGASMARVTLWYPKKRPFVPDTPVPSMKTGMVLMVHLPKVSMHGNDITSIAAEVASTEFLDTYEGAPTVRDFERKIQQNGYVVPCLIGFQRKTSFVSQAHAMFRQSQSLLTIED